MCANEATVKVSSFIVEPEHVDDVYISDICRLIV